MPEPDKTIDIERLLKPIAEDKPAGEPLPAADRNAINELRLDEGTEGALGQLREGEARGGPAWSKVEEKCVENLEKRCKDIQLVTWLTEARVKQRGVIALTGGLLLMKGLHERFWDSFHPVLHEEDDIETRSNRLDAFDKLLGEGLMETPITPAAGTPGGLFWEHKRITQLQHDNSKDLDARKKAQDEGNLRRDHLNAAIGRANRGFYENIYNAVLQATGECENLRRMVDEKFRGAPGFENVLHGDSPNFKHLRENLQDLKIFVEDVLKKKGGLPGAKAPEASGGPAAEPERPAGSGPAFGGAEGLSSIPVSRADAIGRLSTIAEFFQRTEPHSPVAHLVQRAARWGEMPLEKLLDELVKDQNVLSSIRETLGITPPPEAPKE